MEEQRNLSFDVSPAFDDTGPRAEWWAGLAVVITGGWITGLVVTIGGGWVTPLLLAVFGPILTLFAIGKANAGYRISASKPAFVQFTPRGFLLRLPTVQTGLVSWDAVGSVGVAFRAGADSTPHSVKIQLHEAHLMGGDAEDRDTSAAEKRDTIIFDTSSLNRSAAEIARQAIQYKNEYGVTNETLELDVPMPESRDDTPEPLAPGDAVPEGRVPSSTKMTVTDPDGDRTTTAAPSRDDIEIAVGTLSFVPADGFGNVSTDEVRIRRDDDAIMTVEPEVESAVRMRAEVPGSENGGPAVFVAGGVDRPTATAALHLFAGYDVRWRGHLPIEWSRKESSEGCLPMALLVVFGWPFGLVLEFVDHIRGRVPSPESMTAGTVWMASEDGDR